MAKNFTPPPLSEKFVDEEGFISPVWKDWLSTIFQTNEGYATQFGMLLPQVTTDQRNGIINQDNPSTYGSALDQNNLTSGLTIYNTDVDEVQTYFGSTLGWRSVYTT